MKKLTPNELIKCQKIIDSANISELRKKALTIDEMKVANKKKRESYNKEREKVLYVNCA